MIDSSVFAQPACQNHDEAAADAASQHDHYRCQQRDRDAQRSQPIVTPRV
jgi:hypothetical protein